MLPGDRTAIASFADRFQMRQPFTADRDALLAHLVNQFNVRLGMETRLYDAMIEGAMALGKETNRRVIVVLSDGQNWVAPRTSSATASNVVSVAIGRDVMIYGIAMWTNWEGKAEEPSRALNRLADETGGGAVELRESDDINKTFARVAQELHQQYVLGFTPAVLDGKVHRLDVKVKRPNTRVRARRSYLASEKPEGGGRP
jgi:VWFA-related protein